MRSHPLARLAAVAVAVFTTSQVQAQDPVVHLELRPFAQNVAIAGEARVGLFAVSSGNFDQLIAGVEVIIEWDPAVLQLTGFENPDPNPWNSTAFPFGVADPAGLNDAIPPQDGDGFWRAFAPLGVANAIRATPFGTLLTTFVFDPQSLNAGTLIEIVPGSVQISQQTVVVDGLAPGVIITGDLGSSVVTVSQDGGPGGGTPAVVGRTPIQGIVINKESGVDRVSVTFDRAVANSTITVQRQSTSSTVNGTHQGAGGFTHTLQFGSTLADRDRYTVTVVVNAVTVAQWTFSVLLGDCNRDARVDIFDLGRIRTLLRDGTFDDDCNIKDFDAVINIFDLGLVRSALQQGATLPPL